MSLRRKHLRRLTAVLVLLALAFVVPPSIHLNRFRARLSESLSRSLGRQVSVEDVRLRLLPLPGFTFRQLRIADDSEFGNEPILLTSEEDGERSDATLRLSSLWRGRLEIASVSLTHASLNLVRTADGHWNLETLVNRASQVPSAPTAKHRAETRTRFPYIELTESRINFKLGSEKKPFALSNAEFALWLAAENRWNVRLKAVPLRTDEVLSDTGIIRVSGSFDRAGEFKETPFHFKLNWDKPEVDALMRIADGRDPGWRGAVELNAELKGTPADFSGHVDANLDEFRRYDIARPSAFDVRISCDQHFEGQVPETSVSNALEFHCRAPFENGALLASGTVQPLGHSPSLSVRLIASEMPLSALVKALLRAKRTLPDDLSGEGIVDGEWMIDAQSGQPAIWKGSATVRNAMLESATLGPAIVFPESVNVDFQAPDPDNNSTAEPPLSEAVIEPFSLDLGGAAQVSATLDPRGYSISFNGPASCRRLLEVARTLGLQPPSTDLQGSVQLQADYAGAWQGFSPPSITARAEIQSAQLSLRGFSEPLHLSGGKIVLDENQFHVTKLAGDFPKNALAFTADLHGSDDCQRYPICNVDFDLQSSQLRASSILGLLDSDSGSLSLPFFGSSQRFGARWLMDVAAGGRLAAQRVSIENTQAKNVNAELRIANGKLLAQHLTAEVFSGKHTGNWTFDFSGPTPVITGSGDLEKVEAAQIAHAGSRDFGSGIVTVKYEFKTAGRTFGQLASALKGAGSFSWKNGSIETSTNAGGASEGLPFQLWSGQFAIDHRAVALVHSKMDSKNGVRDLSGEIALTGTPILRLVNSEHLKTEGPLKKAAKAGEPRKIAEALP